MYCPKCGKEARGKWCEYCGTQLEIDESFDLNPYENTKEENEYDTDRFDTGKIQAQYGSLDDFDPYGDYDKDEDTSRKKLVIILSVCIAAVVVALVLLVAALSSGTDTDEPMSDAAPVSLSEDLFKKGERYIDIGEYEQAEKIFKEIIDAEDNSEAETLYKILANYNKAIKSLDDYDCKAALRYFEKIPDDYSKYSISDDIETLSDEIARCETAYEIFESIEGFMRDNNYDAAKDSISILDEDALSREDKEKLEDYKDEIEENEEEEVVLSEHEAENLLRGYCESFVRAINEQNFSLVEPFMYKNSEIYTTQKSLIENYIQSRITEKLDSFKLNSLTKISDTAWQARVTESETILYANGSSESKTFDWTYTIEYIDSDFYLTKIK